MKYRSKFFIISSLILIPLLFISCSPTGLLKKKQTSVEQKNQYEEINEQEIRKKVYLVSQDNVRKNFSEVIFSVMYDEDLIKAKGKYLYQCFVIFEADMTLHKWLYLVQYDKEIDECYILSRKDWHYLQQRAYSAVQNYIENRNEWVKANCKGVDFEPIFYLDDSVTQISNINWEIFKVNLKWSCQKDDGVGFFEWKIRTEYDILVNEFTDFKVIDKGKY